MSNTPENWKLSKVSRDCVLIRCSPRVYRESSSWAQCKKISLLLLSCVSAHEGIQIHLPAKNTDEESQIRCTVQHFLARASTRSSAILPFFPERKIRAKYFNGQDNFALLRYILSQLLVHFIAFLRFTFQQSRLFHSLFWNEKWAK